MEAMHAVSFALWVTNLFQIFHVTSVAAWDPFHSLEEAGYFLVIDLTFCVTVHV